MERLPNYDNFQQLWDYYTNTGGLNPTQAAGMLGNIYAESRGNPGAINPGDGSDGTDSRGIIQWNSGRESALRNFAAERGTVANDLLTQAQFSLMEGRVGSEKKGFAQGMAGQTPEEAALGFASGYIRPAAQHIPERAGYGRMMYDIFAGGNPDGVQPGLAFNPEQGERQSRALEEQEANGGPKLGFSNTGNQDIVAQLLGMAQQPMDATISPMEGPRSGLAQDQPPQVGGAAGPRPQTTSPQLGEAPDIDAQVNEMFPAPEGQAPTTELIEQTLAPVAEAAAYNLGVPVEDAPTTPSAIAAAAAAPMPDPADTSEEADKARKKRMLASDMLAVLSVGLGQMSSGQGVNVGGILQGQNARRFKESEQQAEQEAEQAARAQQRQQASVVAQEFTNMNMPGMAKIAMSGEAGLKQALSTMGTIKGKTPATKDGFEALPMEERKALLRRAGMSEQEVEIFSSPGMAAEAADAITEALKGDPAAEGAVKELNALSTLGSQYINDPAVRATGTSAFANSTPENVKAFRDALAKAGASEAELAAAAAETAAEAPKPLSEGEATFYKDIADPQKLAFAMTEEGATAADQIRNAGGERLEKKNIAAGQQEVALSVPTEKLRFLNELQKDTAAFETELMLRNAQAGPKANPIQQGLAMDMVAAHKTKIDNLGTRAPMVGAMEQLITLLSDPSVDRSAGGPLTSAITAVQNVGAQLGFEIGAQEPIENYMARIMESYTGEFFQNFRLEGSGATSDMEAKNYMNAMPNIRDDNLKRLGLAQRIVRMNEREELAATLEQQWMSENSEDMDKVLDRAAMKEFVHAGVAAQARELYPVVDRNAEGWIDSLEESSKNGNIDSKTVVRYVPKGGGDAEYIMFGDLAKELGLEL